MIHLIDQYFFLTHFLLIEGILYLHPIRSIEFVIHLIHFFGLSIISLIIRFMSKFYRKHSLVNCISC
jgi:hypothetical protein